MDEKPAIQSFKQKVNGNQEEVQSMVDETVRRVREQSDKLQAVAMPYADKLRAFAEGKPVLFTFLAIFAVTSFIPISFFIGFVLSSTLSILGVAAVGICVSILATILFAASILLPILFFTSLLSLSILSFLLSLFLLQRLYIHLTTETQQSGPNYQSITKGVKGWAEETSGRVQVPNVLGGWKGSNGTGGGERDVVIIKNEGEGNIQLDVPAGMRIRSVAHETAPGINF